ncbi:MAG: DUF4147 domain-containing protein [Anaerolineaceae bacterium]|nr:DUF4147 domain-containing protein [Anaerolineaceae bacterium]
MMEKLSNFKFDDLLQGGKFISQIIKGSLLPLIDPKLMIHKYMQLSGLELRISDEIINLSHFSEIQVLSIGKAAIPMGLAVKQILGENFTGGLIVTKEGGSIPDEIKDSEFSIIYGSHPIPDQSSVFAAKAVVDYLAKVSEHTLLIVLISGGGSALITYPRGEVKFYDIQRLNKLLIESGASIKEINTIRKHCDLLKGGGLLRLASPAKVVTLILSDVIGNYLDVIASGLTAPDSTSFQDAIDILKKYNLYFKIPGNIQSLLTEGSNGYVHETLKAGDPVLSKAKNIIIGDVVDVMHAAKKAAARVGLKPKLEFPLFECDTNTLALEFYKIILTLIKNETVNCLIAGGESTVRVTGSGLGGRNQDLALRLVPLISGLDNVGVITLATDGGDGPTDAAGAIITGQTAQRAIELGLDINDYLQNNDSYHFFKLLGDQIKIGATGTNLNDLVVIFKTE